MADNNPRPADVLATVVPVKPTEQGARCGRGRGKGRGKGRGRGRGKGKKTCDEDEEDQEEHDDSNEDAGDGSDGGKAEKNKAGKRKKATTQKPKAKAKAKAKTAKTKSAATEKKTRKPNKSKSEDEPAKKSYKAARKKHPRAEASRDEGGDAADDCPETLKKSKATEVPVSESPKEIPTKRKPRGKKTTLLSHPTRVKSHLRALTNRKFPSERPRTLLRKPKQKKRRRSQRIQPAPSSACPENQPHTTELRRQH